jgi:hypothetical protein
VKQQYLEAKYICQPKTDHGNPNEVFALDDSLYVFLNWHSSKITNEISNGFLNVVQTFA